MNLAGETLFITGASRGIGLAIAKRAACDGANIVIAAKSRDPNPKLPGTIHSAAAEIEAAGGQALTLQSDIRDDASVLQAVARAVSRFAGIDILVNNASAISLTPTATPTKRFDLMFGVNVRGTYLCTQAVLPELVKSARAGRNPHVLNLSPPLSMREHWFSPHVAYTMARYGMSECTLGHAGEFRSHGSAADESGCGPGPVPHARDPVRRSRPDPDPRCEADDRQLLHRRRVARQARRDRFWQVQGDARHERLHPRLLCRLRLIEGWRRPGLRHGGHQS